MSGIFLSYRNMDSAEHTRRLHERIALRYGEGVVWRDKDDIPLGTNWLDEIRKAVTQADAVLVVIGPNWLAKTRGRSRLRDADDVLRHEIEWALAGQADGAPEVIPVFVGGARMPAGRSLPASIAALTQCQGQTLRDDAWEADCTALIEGLRVIAGRHRAPEPLRNVHEKLYLLQERTLASMEESRWADLYELANAALRLLDDQARHYPQDALLQNFRGYSHKNRMIALRELGPDKQAWEELGRAEQIFRTMREENETRTAEAYNGLGSVEALRGHFKDALIWIDRALALVPKYPAAIQDREQVLARM